jgi:uncharacterized membrane protein
MLRDYILLYIAAYAATLVIGGTVVLAVNTKALRRARVWFALAIGALFLIPITFCATWDISTDSRIIVEAVSGALIGALLYGVLNELR